MQNISRNVKISVVVLRVAMGWLFLYAGLEKILDPEWSAESFLTNAESLSGFYSWFALPQNIGWVNFLNEWGLTLIGLALILGIFMRQASIAGMLLMLLYYFPDLDFPHVGEHSLLIDDHIIYILVLWALVELRAGDKWSVKSLRVLLNK